MAASKLTKEVAEAYQAGLDAQKAKSVAPGTGPLMADPSLAPPADLSPVDVAPDRPVLSAEQVNALNPQEGRGKLNYLGREIVPNAPSAIAPVQHDVPAVPTGKMIPIYNSAGRQIGEKAEMTKPASNGANNNPFTSHVAPVLDSTGGNVPMSATPAAESGAHASEAAPAGPLYGHGPGSGDGAAGVAQPTYKTIPEHEVRLVSKARQDEIAADLKAQQGAQRGVGVAEAKMADNEGIAAGLEGLQHDADAADILAKKEERDKKMAQMENDISSFSKHVSEQKVDPEHWASNAGIGTKILLTLSAALGGFSQAKGGGPNVGLSIIDDLINQDIDSQKHAIELKKGRIGDMKGIYADAVRRFGNNEQAEAAARIAMNQSMAAKVRQYGAVAKSESASANAELVDSALKLKSDQIMADMNKNVQAQTVMTGGGVAGGKGGPQKLEEDRLVTMPDGKTYYAPTPKVAEAHNKLVKSLQTYDTLTTEAIKLRNDPQSFNPLSDKHSQLEGINAKLSDIEKDVNDLGAVTKTDTTLMGVGPGMATSWKPGVAARIALAQKNAREQMKKISGGLFEVKTGFAPD